MKQLLFTFVLAISSIALFSQNGTYRCNKQRFTDDNDPSKNKEHTNSIIITIDVNEITGGNVIVSFPSESFTFKWDIIKKLDTNVDTENKTVYISYEARFNVANGQSSVKSIATFIQDLNDNSLHIAVNNPSVGTTNWYHNLKKITD